MCEIHPSTLLEGALISVWSTSMKAPAFPRRPFRPGRDSSFRWSSCPATAAAGPNLHSTPGFLSENVCQPVSAHARPPPKCRAGADKRGRGRLRSRQTHASRSRHDDVGQQTGDGFVTSSCKSGRKQARSASGVDSVASAPDVILFMSNLN